MTLTLFAYVGLMRNDDNETFFVFILGGRFVAKLGGSGDCW